MESIFKLYLYAYIKVFDFLKVKLAYLKIIIAIFLNSIYMR